MKKYIYGVGTTKKATPVMIRDAIIKCFIAAHKEILEAPKKFLNMGEKEFEELKYLDIKERIFGLIKDNDGDPESPTKEDLLYVVKKLKEFALNLRQPEVVEKHAGEIMELMHLLK